MWDAFPPDLSLFSSPASPALLLCWVMAGFERDFFICLEPQVPPLTCLNISTQACTKKGPLLFCPPAKTGQSCVPSASGSVTISFVLVQFWQRGLAPQVPAVPPAVPPVPPMPLGSGLPMLGGLCPWFLLMPAASRPSAAPRMTLVCGGHG